MDYLDIWVQQTAGGGLPQFEAAIKSVLRLRNSAFAEVVLLGLVYIVGIFLIWRTYVALSTTAT
jgi:hypothetical protein